MVVIFLALLQSDPVFLAIWHIDNPSAITEITA
jgi:hypothetical protein